MNMPPDIAGVTLFAFASGAPDLFTQVAALASGDHVDIELAVSATFGGGLFIICVVFASVMLTGKGGGGDVVDVVPILDHRSFTRDAAAYLIATLVMLCLLLVGKLNAVDGIVLLCGYFAYLGVCWMTRSAGGTTLSGGTTTNTSSSLDGSFHQASSPFHSLKGTRGASGSGSGLGGGGRTAAAAAVSLRVDDDDAEIELMPFTLDIENSSVDVDEKNGGSPHRSYHQQQQQQQHNGFTTKSSGPSYEPTKNTVPSSSSSPIPVSMMGQNLRPRSAAVTAAAAAIGGAATPKTSTSTLLPLFNSSTSIIVNGGGGDFTSPTNAIETSFGNNTSNLGSSGVAAAAAAAAAAVSPLGREFSVGGGGGGGLMTRSSSKHGLREAIATWLRGLPYLLEDVLHLKNKTGFHRSLLCLTAPVVLCMHATMPAVNTGTYSTAYSILLSAVAPPFFLLATSLGPATLSLFGFLIIWGVASLVLFFLVFRVSPVDLPFHTLLHALPSTLGAVQLAEMPIKSSPLAAAAGGDGYNNKNNNKNTTTTILPPTTANINTPPINTTTAVAFGGSPGSHGVLPLNSPLPPPSFAPITPFSAITAPSALIPDHRPRRCLPFALIAFLQCILWLNATAAELVAIFETIGRIWNVRRDILGATVLAWGETVPDLVAVMSLSKAGHGTMAIAACFGGPVWNLLVSMGAPILVVGVKSGSIDYQTTSGVVVLVVATVVVVVALLIAVPLRYNWKLTRELGWALIAFYAVSQIVFLLAEGIVLE